jgi:hypothetical protein
MEPRHAVAVGFASPILPVLLGSSPSGRIASVICVRIHAASGTGISKLFPMMGERGRGMRDKCDALE